MSLQFSGARCAIRSAVVACSVWAVVIGPARLSSGQVATGQTALASTQQVTPPFDLTPRDGEHPLAPVVRVLKDVRDHIDTNIRDYSCTLTKQERIDGKLGKKQHIFMKVRNEPFSVYMRFLEPYPNREVIYVAGQNDGNLLALDSGWKRKWVGVVSLKPDGPIAMGGQKYPITRVGMMNLVETYLEHASNDTEFAECQVTWDPNQAVNGRSATLIQAIHPQPRREFRGHIVRVFLDNELRVPTYYDAYNWPSHPGDPPPLEESYLYGNLQLNNGFGARDFDKDNPAIFQKNPDANPGA